MFIDAQSALSFMTQQAAHIETEVYRIKYEDLQYNRGLAYIDTSAGEWAKTIEFYSMDRVGKAEWFNSYAKDVPNADILHSKFTHSIEMAAIGYQYTIEEIGYASRLGINLAPERAMAARRAYEEFVDEKFFIGDDAKSWTGLINNPGVNAANVAAVGDINGGTNSTYWKHKTPAQILDDVNSVLKAVYHDSNQVEMADTLALPPTGLSYLATVYANEELTKTVLQMIRETNLYTATTGNPLRIVGVNRLETAGASGKGRMMAYRNSREVLKFHLPVPLRFLPVWRTGPMVYQIPGYFRLGGLEVRLPGAVRYRDGITETA